MCGIVGFSSFYKDFEKYAEFYGDITKKMISKIYNRGPDGNAYYLDKNAVLGHSRLSIIDIEGGRQPIKSACGKYYISYNGEIYNMKEIKDELVRDGYKFNTKTDTEVIVNAYAKYGYDTPKKLNGIFAFAIWDVEKQEMFLARDHFGVKPLYYTIVNKTLVFGSKIESLVQFPKVKLVLGKEGIEELFGLIPSRSEGFGVFKNINEVGFAEYLVFNKKGVVKRKYWELESNECELTYDDVKENTRYLLEDSIKKQMMSDVPISTFLSGGVDSSIITGVVANELAKDGIQLDTYSFDFEGNDEHFEANDFQHSRDRKWVDIMVNDFDTNHRYLECGNSDLIEYLEKSVDAKDCVGMADIDSSLLYFCNIVSDNHKVVLSGECADEIFGGYPWFHKQESLEGNTFPWVRNGDFRRSMLNQDVLDKTNIAGHVRRRYKESIDKVPKLYGEDELEARRREIAYLNLKWFMPTLLERMDRMSMYSGLEARVPFADYRIVDTIHIVWRHIIMQASKSITSLFFNFIVNIKT